MRIPTSVIVMSVVTAIPFGLGVRDQLTKKEVSADEFEDGYDFGDRRGARERQRELEEYEAELRREEAEREKAIADRLAKLDQLYGAQVASMGTLFDGTTLGATSGSFQPEHVRRRIDHATRDGLFSVAHVGTETSLDAIVIRLSDDYETGYACEKIGEKLAQAWGASPQMAWLDTAAHQRASFDADTCQLRFDRYIDPADWVAKLPLNGVGMSVNKLLEQLGPAAESDADYVYWSMPGLGYGHGETQVTAYIDNQKIIGIKATVATDFDSLVAVRDALSAKLKAQPKSAPDSDDYDSGSSSAWEWKRRVPVRLEQEDAGRFQVLVGKTSWD